MSKEERVLKMVKDVTRFDRLKIRMFYGSGAERAALGVWQGFALFGNSHDGLAGWFASNVALGVVNYLPTILYERDTVQHPLFERTAAHAKNSLHVTKYVLQVDRYVEVGVKSTPLLRWVMAGGHHGHERIRKPQYERDMYTLFFELTTKAARIRGLV